MAVLLLKTSRNSRRRKKILKKKYGRTTKGCQRISTILSSNEVKQWSEIVELESSTSSPERHKKLKLHQITFTLLLSADYQMFKLLPYWGHSVQPSSTYLLTKGIICHLWNC